MTKRLILIATALFLLQTTLSFGGVEWKAQLLTKVKDKEATITTHSYAQKGMVREEYVEVGKSESPLTKKGIYWLYKGDANTVYIVDPEEKTYLALSVDSLMQFAGAITQFMKMTISNFSVEVKELGDETIDSYLCKHITINSSYDMEMKIAIMKVKSHIEQSKELWATNAISLKEFAAAFRTKPFKTGMKGLDTLIQKEMAAYKDLGFVIKSITTQKTSDVKGKISEESITEMTISDINVKDLSDDLFTIPADYKQIEFSLKPSGE